MWLRRPVTFSKNRTVPVLSAPKGKFAGGAICFKMETAIQLIISIELAVTMLPRALIKSTLASNPLPIAFANTGLMAFQEAAFIAAYVGQLHGRCT